MGGQLGSSSSSTWRLYSSTAKIPFLKICRFWGVRAGAKMRGAPPLQTRFKRNRHVCIEMVSIETCFPRAFRDEKEAKKTDVGLFAKTLRC